MSVNDVYTKLRTAPAYHPASVDLFDDCTLQAGDVVTVRSGDDSYTLPIFSQHLVWNGASTLQLESTGNEKRSDLPALRKRELNTSYGLGSGGYGAKKANEEKFKKYETHFEQTDEYFSLLATESEWDELAQEGHVTAYTQILQTARDITSVAAKTGIDGLAEDETLYSKINQNAESITSEVTRAKGEEVALSSRITQNAESITSKVSKGEIASTINQTAQRVLIQASKIDLEGYVTVDELEAVNASIANLTSGRTAVTLLNAGSLNVSSVFTFQEYTVHRRSVTVGQKTFNVLSTGREMPNSIVYSDLPHYHAVKASENAGKITLTLGAAQETEGTANFNIADTQFYKDGVSAAYTDAVNEFSLASITLQGSAHANITPIRGKYTYTVTDLYKPGTKKTYYKGNGGYVTGRGDSVSVTPIGGTIRFKRHMKSETPTGTWYTIDSSDYDLTYYFAGTTKIYYVGNGMAGYLRGDSINVTEQGDMQRAYVSDPNGSVTRYSAGAVISGLYNAGPQVNDTYYTRASANQ